VSIVHTTGRPVEILLVEDNPGDVRLTIEGLKEGKVPNNLHVARDGAEAVEYLRREGQRAGAVRPDLILLDLNLPRMDGHEVLSARARSRTSCGVTNCRRIATSLNPWTWSS